MRHLKRLAFGSVFVVITGGIVLGAYLLIITLGPWCAVLFMALAVAYFIGYMADSTGRIA